MHTRLQTEAMFRRLFRAGALKRMPGARADTEIFLALAASIFDPRACYPEADINEHLRDWLSAFADTARLDHVTVRRYLVDYAFLLRDASGGAYRANQAIINRAILPEARATQPRELLEEAQQERALRKRRQERPA